MKLVKKVLVLLILNILICSCFSQTIATTEDTEVTDQVISKTLYTLESVANMSLSGTNRGNWHDRQHLGIYLNAGATFEIRQTNLNLNKDLTLDCLNNNSSTEKTYTIPKNGEWIIVEVTTESVPFIRTVFDTSEAPQIEIRNLHEAQELTYYYYKDNEEEFFDKWRNNNHAYAVIENDRATFLVPRKDIDIIVQPNGSSYQFKTIDEMLEYYHDFVEQYDRYIGLSYETDNALNKNVKTKFFVKANINGAGAAYYSGNHTAQNGDSISSYLSRGWVSLHEFGHGYEGSLANRDLGLSEVMNNILGHYYQITFLEETDGGWLGKKINIEKDMKTARDNATHFNDLTYRERLYVFVNLLDKIGSEKSMGYAHSKYREYLNQGIQYRSSDLYAKSFSEISLYNIIPYFESAKIVPSNDIKEEIYEQELPMLYYLRDLVESDERAEELRKELNLEGKYSLVNNEEIAKYSMTGNIEIDISIDDLEQISGKKMYIKDGSKIVREIVIDTNKISVEDLPVGIYYLQIPNTKTQAYEYSYEYIVVQENTTNTKKIYYKKMNVSSLAQDTQIVFRGLGDNEFATITMDLENKKLNLKSNNSQPHVYFTDEYANLQVFDNEGNKIYEQSYIGNVANSVDDIIPIDFGYTIKIKHREARTRLIFKSLDLNDKEEFGNSGEEVSTYTVTQYGLQKEGTSNEDQYRLYKNKLDKYIQKLESNIPQEGYINKYNYFNKKNKLLSSILVLEEEDRNNYLSTYTTLINGSAPVIQEIKTLEYNVGAEIGFHTDSFSAIDLEDGIITLTNNNMKITCDIPTEDDIITTPGNYTAQVTIQDLDNNLATKSFEVIIKEQQTEDNNPSEEKPDEEDRPTEDNEPEGENKPDEENKPVEDNKPNEDDKTNEDNNSREEENKTDGENKPSEDNEPNEDDKTNEDNKSDKENNVTENNKTNEENNIKGDLDKTLSPLKLPQTGKSNTVIGSLILFIAGIIIGITIGKAIKSKR